MKESATEIARGNVAIPEVGQDLQRIAAGLLVMVATTVAAAITIVCVMIANEIAMKEKAETLIEGEMKNAERIMNARRNMNVRRCKCCKSVTYFSIILSIYYV